MNDRLTVNGRWRFHAWCLGRERIRGGYASAARSVPSMSDNTQSGPIMDGSNDATNEEKLSGLIEQVDHDHGSEGAESMADHLRGRMAETEVELEDRGDTED